MLITNVLLVDDDQDLLRIAQLSLRNVGNWTVHLARCGSEGLTLASQVKPDLILLDVMMPEMDGPETLARLRQNPNTAKIPVIFLTAKVQQHEVHKYVGMGAVGVIFKPFDPMTLPQEVQRLLEAAKE